MAEEIRQKVLAAQRKEITEHLVYKSLSRRTKHVHNKEILNKMASDELEDYDLWKSYTKQDVEQENLRVFQYILISRLFGMTFAVKLLERDSKRIREAYEFLSASVPDGKNIIRSRFARENELIGLIDEWNSSGTLVQ
jgi:ribosome maturation protein Sdo1